MTDSVAPKVCLVDKIKENKKVVAGVVGGIVIVCFLVWWFKFRESDSNSDDDSDGNDGAGEKLKPMSTPPTTNSNKVNVNKNTDPNSTDELVSNNTK